MMNILVLGWYYSSNLGDAVLTDCTAQLLRRKYPLANIVVRDLIGRQNFFRNSNATLRGKLFRILARLDRNGSYVNRHRENLNRTAAGDWDMVVFAGGQLFMDSLAIYVSYLTEEFAKRQIPVFLHACGMGPTHHESIRQQLRQALNLPNVKYLSCRDDVPRLHRLCGNERAVFAADSALWCSEVFGISPQSSRKCLGLGMIDPGSLPARKTEKFYVNLIRRLEQNGTEWKLFTNGGEADMDFARRVLRNLPELTGPEERYLCPAPQSPKELVEQIAAFESLISFRLHSHIIATSLGIPTAAMVWDDKVRLFFQSIGHEERCKTIYDSPDAVLDALAQAREVPYDQELLHAMRETSIQQLLGAIDEIYAPFLFSDKEGTAT